MKPDAHKRRTLLKETFRKTEKQRYFDLLANQYHLKLPTPNGAFLATPESLSIRRAKNLEDYEQKIKEATPTVNERRKQDQLSVQYISNLQAAVSPTVQIITLNDDEDEQTVGLAPFNSDIQPVLSQNGSMGIRQESAHLRRGTKRPRSTTFASNILNFLSRRTDKYPKHEVKLFKLGGRTTGEGIVSRVLSSFRSNNDSAITVSTISKERDVEIRKLVQAKKQQDLSAKIEATINEEKQKSVGERLNGLLGGGHSFSSSKPTLWRHNEQGERKLRSTSLSPDITDSFVEPSPPPALSIHTRISASVVPPSPAASGSSYSINSPFQPFQPRHASSPVNHSRPQKPTSPVPASLPTSTFRQYQHQQDELPESARKVRQDVAKSKYSDSMFLAKFEKDYRDSKEELNKSLNEKEREVFELRLKRDNIPMKMHAHYNFRHSTIPNYYRGLKDEDEPIPEPPKAIIREPSIESINEYITEALHGKGHEDTVVEKFSIPIAPKDLETLEGLNWLNDEVINFYFNLISERSDLVEGAPKVHIFSTFFYAKLTSSPSAYNMLKRWTRKVDIFAKDLILVPVHLNVHWTLIGVNCKKRRISFYDSMCGGPINRGGSKHQQAILGN